MKLPLYLLATVHIALNFSIHIWMGVLALITWILAFRLTVWVR